ncbi:MAG: hypothetical protein RL477_1632, partial [Pseudomonadota bacterium]
YFKRRRARSWRGDQECSARQGNFFSERQIVPPGLGRERDKPKGPQSDCGPCLEERVAGELTRKFLFRKVRRVA